MAVRKVGRRRHCNGRDGERAQRAKVWTPETKPVADEHRNRVPGYSDDAELRYFMAACAQRRAGVQHDAGSPEARALRRTGFGSAGIAAGRRTVILDPELNSMAAKAASLPGLPCLSPSAIR